MPIPGGPELLVIFFVLLLLFGASRLPALARSMGQSAKELRAGFREEQDDTQPPTK
jgi:sec-independent protein translocase protein TatA